MKSITIHGIDADLYDRLKEIAGNQGLSLNKTVKNLLAKSLGFNSKEKKDRRQDFMEFSGIWTAADAGAFEAAVEDFGHVDSKDWQ